jgi:hypothetical protein
MLARTLAPLILLAACAPAAPRPVAHAALEAEVRDIIRRAAGDTAEVSVAFRDLATGDSLLIDARKTMHAASTMKVPVMLELFRRADAGELRMDELVPVVNEFSSIADGSIYTLSRSDDGDTTLYGRVGQRVPVRELVERMITRSSNLATNLLIDRAGPAPHRHHAGRSGRGRDEGAARRGGRPRLSRGDEQRHHRVRPDAGDGGDRRRAGRVARLHGRDAGDPGTAAVPRDDPGRAAGGGALRQQDGEHHAHRARRRHRLSRRPRALRAGRPHRAASA